MSAQPGGIFGRDFDLEPAPVARIYRSTTPAAGAEVGAIVSYEDMANPAAFFTVVGHVTDAWGTEARLVSHETGVVTTSSLRGVGWVRAEVI